MTAVLSALSGERKEKQRKIKRREKRDQGDMISGFIRHFILKELCYWADFSDNCREPLRFFRS